MNPKLLTPRAWQTEALTRAAKLSGTAEGGLALVESNRYGALADRIEALERLVPKEPTPEERARLDALQDALARAVARGHAVHLGHCYQGEYEGCCKYRNPDCPAKHLPRANP